MTTPAPNRRWYHLTPDRFFIGLLAVQILLLLSEQFQWFAFNEKKGWTVLIAVGVVGVAVLVILVWGLVCLLFRRRFQFSFRSLLVFVVAASVPLGWFAWEMERARRQRKAVESIAELGGGVGYDYHFDESRSVMALGEPTAPSWLRELLGDNFFYEVVLVGCEDTEFSDDDARHLEGLPALQWLRLDRTQITDDGLQHLKRATRLSDLSLNYTQVTGKGFRHLKEVTRLEYLHLAGAHINDNGLEHLEGLTDLEILWLERNKVTDAGLEHLEGLNNLHELYLNGTLVSDAGLESIKGLSNLRKVHLYDTEVTKEGVERLQQALPNCGIHY